MDTDSTAVLFIRIETVLQRFSSRPRISHLRRSLVTATEQISQPRVTPDGSEILYVSTPRSATPKLPHSFSLFPYVAELSPGPQRRCHLRCGVRAVAIRRSACSASSKGNIRETFVRCAGAADYRPPANRYRGLLELVPDGTQRAFVAVGSRPRNDPNSGPHPRARRADWL